MGFTDEVVNIGDNLEIAKYGVMQTPGLVVDGRVVSRAEPEGGHVKKIFQKIGVK
jgi:hypothetical protein